MKATIFKCFVVNSLGSNKKLSVHVIKKVNKTTDYHNEKRRNVYISALVLMVILDGIWFSFSIGKIYRPGLGPLMADKPLIPAAGAFYLLYIAGLTFLIVLPALATNQFGNLVSHGAVLGVMTYGTYDLTNLAIVRGWPLSITLIDLICGMLLTAITAAVAFLLARAIG